MRTDTLVYLSGPISAKHGFTVEQNVQASLPTYFRCTQLGIPTFLPHLTALAPGALEVGYRTWMEYDFAVIRRCTHMLMLDRWTTSSGAIEEKKLAEELGMPIYYSVEELLQHVR